jgi:hypothetical protein
MNNRRILKEFTCINFPNGSLRDFISILQQFQQDYPGPKVSWAVGGPRESDSLLIFMEVSGEPNGDTYVGYRYDEHGNVTHPPTESLEDTIRNKNFCYSESCCGYFARKKRI